MDKDWGRVHTAGMVPEESVIRLLNARTAEDLAPSAFGVATKQDSLNQRRRRRSVARARWRLCLTVVWLGLASLSVSGAGAATPAAPVDVAPEVMPWDKAGSELVGDAGDPDQIVFSGNSTFPAEALRKALLQSPSYLLGSHHLAKREAFLSMLRQKLLQGYKVCGFPEPQVTTSYDEKSKRVQVRIVEGPRYYCGPLKVSGVSPAVADALNERLTKPPKKESELEKSLEKAAQTASPEKDGGKPSLKTSFKFTPANTEHPLTPNRKPREDQYLWESGHPAGFAEAALKDLQTETTTVLAEHGFFFPKFNLHPALVPATGLAELAIEVTELGPPGELSAIEVSGNHKNSETELLQFLELKPGMRITREMLEVAEQKLWQSGRFRYYELKPEPEETAGAPSNRIRLQLKVVEFDSVPKLTEPLSGTEQAMLRLGDWLSTLASRPEEDALVTMHINKSPINVEAGLVLSPRQGVLLQVKDAESRGQLFSYSLLLATNGLGVFAPLHGSKLLAVNSNYSVEAHVRMAPNPPESEQRFNLTFAAGWNYDPKPEVAGGSPLQLDLLLAPAAFLALAEDSKEHCKLEGNQCSITTSNTVLKFDATTGRLGELRWDEKAAAVSLRFVTNGFDGVMRNLESGSASLTNQFVEEQPLGSLLAFLGTELARLSVMDRVTTNLTAVERAQAVGAWCRLLNTAVLDPLAQHSKRSAEEGDKAFSIPPDDLDLALARNNLVAMLSGLVFTYCNDWFPKYSWPWTMAREAVLLVGSHGEYIDAEMTRLINSDSTGPLGCLTLAAGLSRMGAPAAKTFATQGLVRLRTADFQRDCRLLFEGNTGLAKTVANLAQVLRSLPPEQVTALTRTLPPAEAKLVQECAEGLHAQPKSPLAESLTPALNHYWEESLRGRVRAKLLELAKQGSRQL